jgi:hypothetical protein
MTQENEPQRLNLNVTQVVGGALAAVTSAIVASRFGVGGTLVGAGLASVVSTTGATVYSHMLRRTGSKARGVLEELPHHGHHGLRRADTEQANLELPPHDDGASPRPTAALATATRPDLEETASRPGGRSRRVPIWAMPVAACVLVFAIALGAISGVEAMTGRPAASWVGGSGPRSGTTVGSLARANSGSTPGATHNATTAPTPTNSPAATAAPAAPTQQPGTRPSAQGTAPATGPSPAASPASSPPPQATPTPLPSNGDRNPVAGE